MAGKKKNSGDDAGMSKTARASSLKKGGKSEGFQASGEVNRMFSLGGGTYTRILDPRNGKSHHLRVGSPSYDEVLSEFLNDEKYSDRFRNELIRLDFPYPADFGQPQEG